MANPAPQRETMRGQDLLAFSSRAAVGNRGRSALMLLAVAIGVASVVLLVSLGESARQYVSEQFSSLGSNLLIVLPGRSETVGGPPPLLGITPRDLTLSDAAALGKIAAIRRLTPVVVGAAPVARQEKSREVTIIGAAREIFAIRRLVVGQGTIWPEDDERAQFVCVLGAKVKEELFGKENALGQKVRIGSYRFRVLGIMLPKASSLGDDLADMAIIPVAAAQTLFNTSSLFRIVIEAESEGVIAAAKERILATIRARHEGEDDVTVITQDAILVTFNKIFQTMTLSVAGIAAISLVVAGIIIMNVMLVAVSTRRGEIGLLKALGAPRRQILALFLAEAGLISLTGALCGIGVGVGILRLLAWFLPQFPFLLASWSILVAAALALATGLLFGILPARRAADLAAAAALSRR